MIKKRTCYCFSPQLIFCILIFAICGSSASVGEQERKANEDNIQLTYAQDAFVKLDTLTEGYLDFIDNPYLSPEENDAIKTCIIHTILSIYGLNAEVDKIGVAVEESREWYDAYDHYKDGWTVIDELKSLEESHVLNSVILTHIDANFMRKPKNVFEENQLLIAVPILESSADKTSILRLTYDFYFKRINGEFKVIAITVEA